MNWEFAELLRQSRLMESKNKCVNFVFYKKFSLFTKIVRIFAVEL